MAAWGQGGTNPYEAWGMETLQRCWRQLEMKVQGAGEGLGKNSWGIGEPKGPREFGG